MQQSPSPLLSPSCSTTYTDTSCTPEPSSAMLHKTYDRRDGEDRIPTPNSSHPHQWCPFPAAESGLTRNYLRPSMDRAHGSARLKKAKGRRWEPCCVGDEKGGPGSSSKPGCVDTRLRASSLGLGAATEGHSRTSASPESLRVLCWKNQPQTHPAKGHREAFRSVKHCSEKTATCNVLHTENLNVMMES